ncbi:sensor histidine kinase [Microbacterium cremeum]|uniref:sensor histidine kinase n=1 Tax=Microbacterium cremeum TaxID=2782169 RepID=UPI0018880529|nr:histidine kinase [Microbacterium cremeum]
MPREETGGAAARSEPNSSPSSTHSRSVRHTWLYTLGSIVFFVGFFAVFVALLMLETFAAESGALTAAIIVLQLVAGAVQIRYCWFLRVGRGGGLPSGWWTAALLAPAAAVWVLGLLPDGFGFTAGASLWAATCLIACLVPRRGRWLLLALGAVMLLGHALLAAALTGAPFAFAASGGAWATSVYALLLPFMVITSLWWWEIVVELDRNRRAAAQLAVAQERLRFASDLHDIQGHHLQVISLKAELAERLLSRDPDAARENIREVRLIAKQALEETRSLVAGYRQVALDEELENAREVLTATGARCTLQIAVLPSDAASRSALASVVREATTNILRHSEATEVSIVLSTDGEDGVLEIVNDGVMDDAGPRASGGSGIAGLRERLASVGGALDSGISDGRFALRARVPLTAAVTA